MTAKKTSVFENGMIWFGAAVGLGEILSGTYLAPLGFAKGFLSILIGHVIGCVLLYLAGVIGADTGKSAMETTTLSYGKKGAYIFAALNVIQLVGWTAIMIYDGALAANEVFGIGNWVWALVIGGLILLWVVIGIKSLGKLNIVAMTALFVLTIVLSVTIFGGGAEAATGDGSLSFGAAIELSVAMPLSWVPVISDYTREAQKPRKATLWSVVIYCITSCWMYTIGMGAAIFAGTGDIAKIIKASMGVVGLLIVILATVTTTFLDAYSAGISSEVFSKKISGKYAAVAATIIGTAAAMIFPMDDITSFLYLIGSVFAPMIAIMIVDYFILHKSHDSSPFCVTNIVIWVIGFILYRVLMRFDLVIGYSLVDIAATMVLCLLASLIHGKKTVKG